MMDRLNLASSFAASILAQGRGIAATTAPQHPKKTLKLYDIENCPYCRIVREVLTKLDLNVVIYPCPKNGTRFRTKLEQLGGKSQFPFLIDPNTDTQLYESEDIIHYLLQTYGHGRRIPGTFEIKYVRTPSSMVISGARILSGMLACESKQPKKLLELYSFESSPYARLVREKLCEAEIPYIVRNVGRTQWQDYLLPPMRKKLLKEYGPTNQNRIDLIQRSGQVTVPYLVDPNTKQEMGESATIIDYLETTYCTQAD